MTTITLGDQLNVAVNSDFARHAVLMTKLESRCGCTDTGQALLRAAVCTDFQWFWHGDCRPSFSFAMKEMECLVPRVTAATFVAR